MWNRSPNVRTLSKRLCCSVFFIACVAFALRAAILYVIGRGMPVPGPANAPYGFEVGRVAESIALGKGFSSPLLLVDTGPTAYLCPAYPYLLASIFKLWGIYSLKSRMIIQTLNCLFSALTIFPIYAIAKRTFGGTVAVFSSWLWVVLPTAWHIPIADIWDTALSAFCFAVIFLATLALSEQRQLIRWAGYGVLWAIAAMINASLLSVFPFFLAWLIWGLRKQSIPWLGRGLVTALLFVLCVAPWTARNYRIFHKFIPMRSPFGLVLWLGNSSSTSDAKSFSMHPVWNLSEAENYKRMGEIPYMEAKQRTALAFMRFHPMESLGFIPPRIASTWFAVTDRPHESWATDPTYLRIFYVVNAVMILLSWLGVAIAWHTPKCRAALYFMVLLIYPVVFYITVTLVRYRFPMEPLLTILAVYGAACVLTRISSWISRLHAHPKIS